MEEKNIPTPDEGTEQEPIAPEEETLEGEGDEGEVEKTPEPKPFESVVDWKKKFSESARESQILVQQIKRLNDKIGDISREEAPSERELHSAYPDWDSMDAPARDLARKNIILERRLNKVHSVVSQLEADQKWGDELERFFERVEITGSFPELKGRESEFRKFALKPTHKGVALDVLAKAFLYGAEPEKAAPKKGSLMEKGSGGPKSLEKSQKGYTSEELNLIRKADPKKYREIVERGEINTEGL